MSICSKMKPEVRPAPPYRLAIGLIGTGLHLARPSALQPV